MDNRSWVEYRRYRRRSHALWLAGLTVAAAITILALPLLGAVPMRFLFIAGPLFLFMWLVAVRMTGSDFIRRVACPKCGAPFFARQSRFGVLRGRCPRCGAPNGSEQGD